MYVLLIIFADRYFCLCDTEKLEKIKSTLKKAELAQELYMTLHIASQ